MPGRHRDDDRSDTSRLEEAVTELTSQVARLARAIEDGTMRLTGGVSTRAPEIRYQDTIHPPRVPRNLSWHEKVREKKVSLPAAGGYTAGVVIVVEILRSVAEHFAR